MKKKVAGIVVAGLFFSTATVSAGNGAEWDYRFDVDVSQKHRVELNSGVENEEAEWTTPQVLFPELNELEEAQTQIVSKINEQRKTQNLNPLNVQVDLTQVANAKAKDMFFNQYYEAVSPTYGSPKEMVQAFGWEEEGIVQLLHNENLEVSEITKEWLTHNELMNPKLKQIGVSLYGEKASSEMYWVLLASE